MNTIAFQLVRMLGHLLSWGVYGIYVLLLTGKYIALITPFGWWLWPFEIASIQRRARQRRRQRALVTLGYLRHAVHAHQPLDRAMLAAAGSERGTMAQSLRRTGWALHDGRPVADAADDELVDARSRSLLRVAEKHGTLPATLDRLYTQTADTLDRDADPQGQMRSYPLVMALAILIAAGGVMVVIVPKFIEIYNDFGTSLPDITMMLIEAIRWLMGPMAPVEIRDPSMAIPGFMLLLLVLSPVFATGWLLRTGRPRGLVDAVRWRCWPWRRGERASAWADVMRTVGDALELGEPAERAVASAASLKINTAPGPMLERWRERCEAGEPIDEAAQHAGMPAVIVTTLRSGRLSHQPGRAARFLADLYDADAKRAGVAWAALRSPISTLLLAVAVGFIAVALLMPLVTLIDSLTWEQGTPW